MSLTDLFTDDQAVSPVISTILMVAITVILVAVVGSFVLDVGAGVTDTVPSAQLTIAQTNQSNDLNVTVAHNGGQTLDEENVMVRVDGKRALNGTGSPVWSGSGSIIAGDSVTVDTAKGESDLSSGQRLTVVWESDSGRTSSILREYVVQ